MPSLADMIASYTAYHRDWRNRATHFIGVPAIAFAILIPMTWLRADLGGGREGSLAMAFVIVVLGFYVAIDRPMALLATIVFVPMLAVAERIGTLPLSTGLTVFGSCFVGGWAFQLIGHALEGRRPALVDNVMQIFVAPLFLIAEVVFALGLRHDLRDEVAARLPHHRDPGKGDGAAG
jgi:uncharacterized membrane protein YGL010W